MGWRQQVGPAATELGLAFVGLLGGGIVALLATSLAHELVAEGAGRTSVQLLVSPLATVAAAMFYWRVSPGLCARQGRRGGGPATPPASALRTGLVVVIGVLAALGGSTAIALLVKAIGGGVQEQAAVVKIMQDARTAGPVAPAIALAGSAIFLAPLAEEWLFRGLLFRRVREVAGPLMAYATSGVAFALIHNNVTGFPVYLWLGVVFAATQQHTGRLSAAMAVHLGNNAFVLASLYWG